MIQIEKLSATCPDNWLVTRAVYKDRSSMLFMWTRAGLCLMSDNMDGLMRYMSWVERSLLTIAESQRKLVIIYIAMKRSKSWSEYDLKFF